MVYEYASLWDMPSQYWRSKYAPMTDEEIELINVSREATSSPQKPDS